MKLILLLVCVGTCLAQTAAITTKDLLSCGRNIKELGDPQNKAVRTGPKRTIGEMRAGEEGYVYTVVSVRGRVYINWYECVFPKPGVVTDPNDLSQQINPETRIRKTERGFLLDCDRTSDVLNGDSLYADSLFALAPVVGTFHQSSPKPKVSLK